MSSFRERLSIKKWILTREGVPRVEVLALVTLVILLSAVLGRALISELRPHIDEDNGRTRAQLQDEARFAMSNILREVRAAGRASTEKDDTVLAVYHGAMFAEREPLDVPAEPIRFFLDESQDLVVEEGDERRVLARRVRRVEFRPLFGRYIGMSLYAKADGEILEIRELLLLRQRGGPTEDELSNHVSRPADAPHDR